MSTFLPGMCVCLCVELACTPLHVVKSQVVLCLRCRDILKNKPSIVSGKGEVGRIAMAAMLDFFYQLPPVFFSDLHGKVIRVFPSRSTLVVRWRKLLKTILYVASKQKELV